jgi:putative heme-binding domain-containing protein
MTTPQLLDQLKSGERWVRSQARRVLADRPLDEVIGATEKWIEAQKPSDPNYSRLMIDALGIYETHEVVDPVLLKRLLGSPDHRVRAYATRVVGSWSDRLPTALALLAERAADDHPRVRLEAVVAASYVNDPKAVEVASIAVDKPMDRFLNHALTQAVHALKPQWKPAFDAGKLTFGAKGDRFQYVLKADGSKDVLGQLLTLIKSGKMTDAGRDSALILLASIGGVDELTIVMGEAFKPGKSELGRRVLEEFANSARSRKVIPPGGGVILRSLLQQGDPALRPGVLLLAGVWGIRDMAPTLEAMAKAEGAPAETRRAALEGLSELGAKETLESVAKGPYAASARRMAIAALARIDVAPAAACAAAFLGEPGREGEVDGIVDAFLARQGGSQALSDALVAGKISADVAKLALRTLSTAGRQDEPLRTTLNKAAGISTAAVEYTADYVRWLGQEALTRGDPANGEKVFRGVVTNCVSCHAIGGAGGKVGPDVSAVGTGLPIDMVVESVLWPNRQVKEGFGSIAVLTKSDQIYQGFHASEDKQTLILRDPAREDLIRIPVAEIKSRKDIGSVMPEGLTNGLTRAELRDLIRFLADLGKPGPFRVPDKALVRRWLVATSPARETWLPKYSTVSGELPLEDVNAGWVRFEVEVLKPGRFHLMFNNATGVRIYREQNPLDSPEMELAVGRHVFTLSVDKSEREGAGLRCQIDPAPRSTGELRILTDR